MGGNSGPQLDGLESEIVFLCVMDWDAHEGQRRAGIAWGAPPAASIRVARAFPVDRHGACCHRNSAGLL